MSDEYLERIEAKLDRVIATQAQHTAALGEHSMTLAGHTATLEEHSQRFERLDTRLAAVETTVDRLDMRVRTVEVTLETTVPQAILQIAEGHAMLQASMDRGFADMKVYLDRRIGPFEETVRQHSVMLSTLAAGPRDTPDQGT